MANEETHLNVKLNLHGARRVLTGHPWVRRKDLQHFKALPPAGTVVRLQDAGGDFLGHAFSDGATGELAYRVVSRERRPALDASWFAERVERALGLRRARLAREPLGACRLLNGENDGLPGIFCDKFGPFAVLDLLSPGARAFLPWVEEALRQQCRLEGLLRKVRFLSGDRQTRVSAKEAVALEPAFGAVPERRFAVGEGGLKFWIDLRQGAHEGLFLDQRENRALVGSRAAGREVLNCFCYTGSFSAACLAGGAARTVNVDLSKGALAWARDNLALNGFDPEAQEWHAAEAFEILGAWKKKGRRFGLVIQDPPPFSRNKHGLFQAAKHYGRLAEDSLALVEDKGLAAFACGAQDLARSTFYRYLAEAAQRAGKRCRLVSAGTRCQDFPVLEGFPEGDHQKFALIQVEGAGGRGELTGLEACV